MKLVTLPGKVYSPGSRLEIEKETLLDSVRFKVHKFNNRPRPEKTRVVIFSCFSEFGSEIVGCLYCIPMLLQSKYLGYYSVAMGWRGRDYLYRHLVDEFWEIGDEYQYLRDYCRAFHHESRNLRLLEKAVTAHGKLAHANELSSVFIHNLKDKIKQAKQCAAFPKMPSVEKVEAIKSFLKPNMVGITARNRRCYGRNLDLDYYKRLIDMLEGMGYNPIWLGEEATTHECPYQHIPDFRTSEHARDFEKTLALVSKLEFTIQYWTASSRLAGLVGTPFIIFESPDQIWGMGQEGTRLNLCTRGKKKLVISHFRRIKDEPQLGLDLTKQAIDEMKVDNYESIIGAVLDPAAMSFVRQCNLERIGEV